MATSVNKERCYHGTLSTSSVDTVCIVNPSPTLTIVNRSSSEIYFTVGASTAEPGGTVAAVPTVGGDDTFVLPANNGQSLTVPAIQSAVSPPLGTVVKLISSGSTVAYSVEAAI